MTSFVRYQNAKPIDEVPVSPNDTWVNIDLALYLDDPNAIGVILRSEVASGSVTAVGAREVGSGNPLLTNLDNSHHSEFPIKFVGAGKMIDWNNGAQTINAWVVGEILGPHVKLHDAPVASGSSPWGSWQVNTVTLQDGDLAEDVEAVIHRNVYTIPTNVFNPNTAGLREVGSGVSTYDVGWTQAYTWLVTKVNEEGKYQSYTDQKFGFPNSRLDEVGYILKSSSVVVFSDPSVEGILGLATQTPGYGTFDMSAFVSSEAIVAGGYWVGTFQAAGFPESFLRATGSSDDPHKDLGYFQGQTVLLDANLQGEYTLEDAGFGEFFIQWYEVATPPAAIFLYDVDLRSVMASAACPTLPLDSGSDRRSPLDATSPDAQTPMDTASDTDTPLDAEVEPWREDA